MTSAELKTIRESLGLTVTWCCIQQSVQERTWRHWESGRNQVPDGVADFIGKIEHLVNQSVDQAVSVVNLTPNKPESVVLVRYRNDEDLWNYRKDMESLPATLHAAIISRVRRKLWEIGVPSTIQYMDEDCYIEWLDGRGDSESLRAAWAASIDQ